MSENNKVIKRAQEILTGKDYKRVESSSLLAKLKAKDSKEIILIDLSGSMSEPVNQNETKFSIVRDLVRSLEGRRIFTFSSTVHELELGKELYPPSGGTNMALAFQKMHEIQAEHIILITDGIPDDEPSALHFVKGLKIEIIYVGPDPAPAFLKKLAALLGTKFENLNLLKSENRTALRGKVMGFLKA